MCSLFLTINDTSTCMFFEEHLKGVSVGGKCYNDTGLGDWTGFYDWLRTSSGMIVGVRYWPFEQGEFILGLSNSGNRLKMDSKDALLLFFENETTFDETLSGDQSFEECRILKSDGDSYGIMFGCSALSEDEQAQLKKCCN